MKNPLKGLFKGKPSNYAENLPITSLQATSMMSLREMTRYQSDNYDSGYSSVRAISDTFITINPTARDANGKPIEKTPNALNCLARPNREMGNIEFRDTWATWTQVYDKVYILVHERDGAGTKPASENVREDRIAGYTFLLGVVEDNSLGELRYKVNVNGVDEVYFPYQVMTFYDVNPAGVGRGYSPARAAKRWTRIEDYIADYQAGFFENGAVPAGQFIITAPTAKEYEDIVNGLESKHRGAGSNNNVVYTFQPIDQNSGKPGQATITWVPFNTHNKDLALKDILNAVGGKTDSVYRVSAMQRAITDAPNFATAQVDDRNFIEKTVRPFTLKKYARLQHELNRITTGLGYGITFDLKTPYVAEEEKFKAETNNINVTALNALVGEGYTLDSAIDALALPPNWKLLKKGDDSTTDIDNDKSDVDEGGETADAPEAGAGGAAKRTGLKATNQLSQDDIDSFTVKLEEPARQLLDKQIELAISTEITNAVDPTEEDQAAFLDAMMLIISDILLTGGAAQWEAGRLLLFEAGIEAPDKGYELSQRAIDDYRDYLQTVFKSYSAENGEAIRSVMDRAKVEQLTRQETEARLRDLVNIEAWRIRRIAVTEVNRSGGLASVEAMVGIAEETSATIEKSMLTTGSNPCSFCRAHAGQWVAVDHVMLEKGDVIVDKEGAIFVNTWDDNYGHDIHANGHCVPQFRVVK